MMFGVKVKFLDDEYLWVTEGDNKFQIRPKLFETKEEAQDHANIWGLDATVEEYNEPDDL